MKLLVASVLVLVAVGMFAQVPQTVPEIHLDANPHTITMMVNCDGDRVASIDTYVDGVFLMSTVMPFPAPTILSIE